jgi:molybdopterin biosynthesis enzyme
VSLADGPLCPDRGASGERMRVARGKFVFLIDFRPGFLCWFGVIRKKATIELVGNGMGNRVNAHDCTSDVVRRGTGSSSLSPLESGTGR